jgi:hypothetical protein
MANAAFAAANSLSLSSTDTWVRQQANIAFGVANAAFAMANTDANNIIVISAYANAAFGAANASFLAGNVRGSYANAAFGAANASFLAGNVHASYANAAFGAANASFIKANSATDIAQGAFDKANTAYNAGGIIAGAYANAAFGAANAAFIQANTAVNNAAGASSYANSAFAKANTFDSTILTLQGTDLSQNTSIIASGAYANAGFTQANTAISNAGAASSYANSAFATANAAVIRAGDTMTGDLAIGVDGTPKKLTVTGLTTLKGQVIVQDNLYGQHLLPSTPGGFDLGSPDRRWRKLYIIGNTIDLDGATIGTTPDGGGIVLTSNTGATFSVTGTAETSIGYFNSLQANSNVDSTSTTTGALIVNGGIGANGNIYVAGTVVANLISGGTF